MKHQLLDLLCCLECKGDLTLSEAEEANGEVESGQLVCIACNRHYPIVNGVPRFVPSENYAHNFGFQWNHFRRTQLDSYSGLQISRERFFRETGWNADDLAGKTVLDIGCGAGRFAEVALSCTAQVVAVDYSEAADACWCNLHANPNLHVVQADVSALPFQPGGFDYIYCLGVLQHTPGPRNAFLALSRHLKPGGRIAVDVYLRHWNNWLHPKYWMRPVTRRLPQETLFKAVERSVPFLLPISMAAGRVPVVGRLLRRFVPVANYHGIYPLNAQQLHEWAVLDTFDWLSPAYDQPQTPEVLRYWLVEAGLEEIEVLIAGHLVGRGRKPAMAPIT